MTDSRKSLKKIKSQNDAHDFFYWLKEHPEIKNVQGYNLLRRDSSSVYGFQYGSGINDYHYNDIDYLWKERKMINDWIDGQLE